MLRQVTFTHIFIDSTKDFIGLIWYNLSSTDFLVFLLRTLVYEPFVYYLSSILGVKLEVLIGHWSRSHISADWTKRWEPTQGKY